MSFNSINNPGSSILKAFGQELQKGKPAAEGEIREWGGRKYQKIGGKWNEVTDPKKAKSEDSKEGEGEKPQGSGTGGPPVIDKNEIAHLTHMKSLVDSDPKGAYKIFQSLSPEAQHVVPQDVVNKMVDANYTTEEKDDLGVDYDKLGDDKREVKEAKEKLVGRKFTKNGADYEVVTLQKDGEFLISKKKDGRGTSFTATEEEIRAVLDAMGREGESKNLAKALQTLGLEKARPTKYFKREGTAGNYKYYYTEEEYKKAKGGVEGKSKTQDKLVEGDSVSYQKTKGAGVKIPFKGEVVSVDKDGKYAHVRNSIGDIDYVPVSDLKKSSGVESKSQDVGKSISIKKDLPYMTVTEKLKGQKLIVTGSRTVNFASGPKKYYTVKDEKGNEHEIRAEYVDDAKKEKKPAEKKEVSDAKKSLGVEREYGVSNKKSKDGTVMKPDPSGGFYRADAKTGRRVE